MLIKNMDKIQLREYIKCNARINKYRKSPDYIKKQTSDTDFFTKEDLEYINV
jgi:hypothetical protein